MIKKIGSYYLLQDINSANNLVEFSDEDYLIAEQAGMKRMFESERMFLGSSVEFASVFWDSITIGSYNDKIYKITAQLFNNNKRKSKKILKELVDYLNIEAGKYNEHSFFTDKYMWHSQDGILFLNRRNINDVYSINLILTSNIIREQILKK